MLDQEELKRRLYYNPDTGIFTWKINPSKNIQKGTVAGTVKGDKDGYKKIKINDRSYRSHRLAWFYVYGKWPNNQIDHINGITNDNRICNLRDVSQSQNLRNLRIHREGRLVGCVFMKRLNLWQAQKGFDKGKRKIYLGCFLTEKEAHDAFINHCQKDD